MSEKVKIVAFGGNFPVFQGGEFDIKDIKFGTRDRKDPDSKKGGRIKFEATLITSGDDRELIIPNDSLGQVVLANGKTLGELFNGKEVILPSRGHMVMKPEGPSGETNGRKWQIHVPYWNIQPGEVTVA